MTVCLTESRFPQDVRSSSSISSRRQPCFPQKRISLDGVGEEKKKNPADTVSLAVVPKMSSEQNVICPF